jgi:alpha-1,2-mannosyltransferase
VRTVPALVLVIAELVRDGPLGQHVPRSHHPSRHSGHNDHSLPHEQQPLKPKRTPAHLRSEIDAPLVDGDTPPRTGGQSPREVTPEAAEGPQASKRAGQVLTPMRIACLAGLVSLGIACYQLSLPNVLTGVLGYNLGYDDGVYLGVATRLVHGVLPYRDFVFVHPPGIAYLMSPVALIGRIIGTHGSLVIARCVTAVVVGMNAMLAGILVRSAGRVAVAVSSFSLALWPLTVSVDRTLELEPYLVFFCLLGAILVFERGDLAAPRRVFLGGLVFGFAFVVKVWGVLPIAAVLLCCVPRWRRGVLPLALGLALGILVPCLPFLLIAPHAFFHDVIVAQLSRNDVYSGPATPLNSRFFLMSGLGGLSAISISPDFAEVLFALLAIVTVFVFGIGIRHRTRMEWFALASSAIVLLGMFDSPDLYDHYAYFPVAFFVLLIGVCVSRLATRIVSLGTTLWSKLKPASRMAGALSFWAVLLSAVAFFVSQDASYAQAYLSEASNPGAQLASVIPAGACVISDYPVDLIVANRYTPAKAGCPAVVDPYGMWLADDNGTEPHPAGPYNLAFVEEWFQWLKEANYVELRIPFSDFLPWSQYSITWFQQNYRLVAHFHVVYAHGYIDTQKDEYVYKRIG